jgi:predicted DNA repair protein MutK
MPSGLIALLDDVATIAKLAATSLDDAAAAAGKASTKAAGVVIDDTAVTPRYVVGLAPERELPIIGKIAAGSLKNKLLLLLPAALLLVWLENQFDLILIVPLLMIGGSYLAFEATEKIAEVLLHDHGHEEQLVDAMADPADMEALQVKGAIRTDLILSAEITAIALAALDHLSLITTAIALIAVALAITAGVYGVVALIVKLDDIGLHLSERKSSTARAVGEALVRIVPTMLSALSTIGTAAMLWVGGGIILHGLEELHILDAIPQALHDWSTAAGQAVGAIGPIIEWIVYALGSAVAGLVVGGIIVVVVRRFVKHPEELIVD